MCAQSIDNVPYPDSWAELKKDSSLMKIFEAYSKPSMIHENVLFLKSKRIPNRDYVMFVHDNARTQVNISSALKSKMDDLVKNSPRGPDNRPQVDWNAREWKTHLESVEDELIRLLNRDHLRPGAKFWKSDHFLAYHAKLTGKADKTAGGKTPASTIKLPWKTLQLLGWEDARNPNLHKPLTRMVVAIQQKDMRAAKAAHRDALKWQSDKSWVSNQSFENAVKAFNKKGLIPK